jgi:hypothetical protein
MTEHFVLRGTGRDYYCACYSISMTQRDASYMEEELRNGKKEGREGYP